MIHNSYGKSGVRLMKVNRSSDEHRLFEVTVDIRLEGEFEEVHTKGDNTPVIPTDTMKNTVYALGRNHEFDSAEQFGMILSSHFLDAHDHVTRATIWLTERPWSRMEPGGKPHPHAFIQDTGERYTTYVDSDRKATTIKAGIQDLFILKSTDSGFSGYIKDEYTTLPETDDRIFATTLKTTWTYGSSDADFNNVRDGIRSDLLNVFAGHQSLSVQHTLYAMGESVLENFPDVSEIHMMMPNKHFLKSNLEPFGLDNPNVIFYPVEEPYGDIEATLRR